MNLLDLKKFEFTPLNIFKLAILAVVGLVVVIVLFSFVGSFFKSFHRIPGMPGKLGMMEEMSYAGNSVMSITGPSARYDMAPGGYGYGADGDAMLSVRNVASTYPVPQPPMDPQSTGDTAEDFEVTEYNASIETTDSEKTCETVTSLKARDYVIFENANEYDRGCSYTFKVKHANVDEVLSFIEGLDPKDLSENTYTIKSQIDDFTSETEILEKKRTSIDETLEAALKSYDEIQRIATNSQNAEALARIIDSKIQLIERLTQERININEQLDRYARAKADQLDRLEYTRFYVSVYEQAFIDGENLADSWKESIRMFFLDVNQIAQDLTVNLILLFFLAIQYIIYVLLLVVVAKYVWKAVKYIWYR